MKCAPPLPFPHYSLAEVAERERLLRVYQQRRLTPQERMKLVSLMRRAHEPRYPDDAKVTA